MKGFREDLLLAAYAVSRGYTINETVYDEATGVPATALVFVYGRTWVWFTSRGWRVADLIDGEYEKPKIEQFHPTLKAAIDAGIK